MFKVDSNQEKNRLYITIEKMDINDIQPILDKLTTHISKLISGFTCLVDIRRMDLTPDIKGYEYIEVIQGALTDAGMGKVVRVVDKNNIDPQDQMDESSKSLGYKGTPVFTFEEAESLLDK